VKSLVVSHYRPAKTTIYERIGQVWCRVVRVLIGIELTFYHGETDVPPISVRFVNIQPTLEQGA